jgi:hypothetical protein
VPQQRPELADRLRRDPRLGQQISPQQLRQDRGVHLLFSELTPLCLDTTDIGTSRLV